MQLLGRAMGALIQGCYGLVGNYVLAIVIFTLLTKVILFPVALWTHRNGIKMVSLTPELDRMKADHFGDSEAIAEETQKLYKREHYHPLASMVPLIVQLILLVGVIGAVRTLLDGTDSILAAAPSEMGGAALLMPLAAGASALILGLAQNRLNPLQREQSKAGQWSTNGLSIAISLALGAFVPVGVGVYWICSNLFTIVQQLVLNAVMPAKKYVDYEALAAAKAELAKLNALSAGISREDKKREKEDYKRFFHVVNKHLVFYSESSGFYKYFQDVIEYLLDHSNVTIHYITSDPKDQIFDIAKTRPRIRPYYIGEKRLITLFMKMDADMVVMTVPDLDNMYLKRSYVRRDVEYVYMFHAVVVGLRTLRPKAIDNYDTVLVAGDYIEKEIRRMEEETGTKAKKLVPCGYCVIDNMAKAYERMEKAPAERTRRVVLVAPSWSEGNILESCLHPLSESLIEQGYDVIARPHPQYLRRFPQKMEEIVRSCQDLPSDRFQFQMDFSSNETVYTADLLVTDWSGIGYEYSLSTKRPVLFIDTPMKIVNPQCEDWNSFEMEMRKTVGISLSPEQTRKEGGAAAEKLINARADYAEVIDRVRREHIYHFGESGKYGAKYIIESLQKRQEGKKQ